MTTEKEIDDAIQAYLTEQCYGEGAQPDGLMIAAEAGWRLMRKQRDAFERDYTAVGERNKELHDMYFAALALAEQRAGERDRLRDWLNIAKQFVWDEEIVENIDAELAAAPPPETAKEPSA